MVELFAVRVVHRLIAECESLHPVPPVTRPRVPHASEVERALTGTFTRIAPAELSLLALARDCFTRFVPLRPTASDFVSSRYFPVAPPRATSPLDRIAGLLALETSDLQRQPLLVGLLDEASIERGEHLSAYHALRVGILADGKSRLLSSGW